MNLYPITLGELSYVESGQFINRLLTDITETGFETGNDPDVKEMLINIQNESVVYNKALLQIRAREESLEIAKLDLHRDRKITTLRRMHSVAEYTDIPEEKKAYDIIGIVLKKFDRIEILNFEAESLSIDKLIEEITSPEYKPSADILKMLPHVDNLKVSNDKFKSVFNTRSVKEISEETFNTKQLKKNIFASYREFAEYAKLMANRRNTDYYINLLKIVNNGREYFANLIAKRNGGDKPTPPTGN